MGQRLAQALAGFAFRLIRPKQTCKHLSTMGAVLFYRQVSQQRPGLIGGKISPPFPAYDDLQRPQQ
jgi:hypothetical protein